jgi:hypothetical protein
LVFCNSYSILTSQPPFAVSFGQQLTKINF